MRADSKETERIDTKEGVGSDSKDETENTDSKNTVRADNRRERGQTVKE